MTGQGVSSMLACVVRQPEYQDSNTDFESFSSLKDFSEERQFLTTPAKWVSKEKPAGVVTIFLPASRLRHSTPSSTIDRSLPDFTFFSKWCRFNSATHNSPRRQIMKRIFAALSILALLVAGAQAQDKKWRQASEKELRGIIPARATVITERIETEMRTASGITDGGGRFIAGVVMITAGYQAEGKYSHFLITQAPIKVGEIDLRPGEYVFGTKRMDNDILEVSFYESASGKSLGTIRATLDQKRGPVYSLAINPEMNGNGKPVIRVGRFYFEFMIQNETGRM